ncbi:SDR family NAD(P)-dependent oxidoreductase [Sporosarcina ureae]|uniref:SDR family NAD(P)-dependent oxidoreductase n=1 Tax=Sporosarcina ureae TaxID=1571 RepID=UPI0026F1490D|nr:SDR family oxidoreductase [Sporosarcina ureae]
MKKFENKTVVITGAGSGMGRETAYRFAKEGANVIVVDLNEEPAKETVKAIQADGGVARVAVCDVSNRQQVIDMVDEAAKEFGTIDIMFNNAGVPMSSTKTEDVSENLANLLIDVNLKGVFFGIQAVIPYMQKQKSGVIINTASINGVKPRPFNSMYSATKSAVITLTKSLGLELAEYGVRVVGVNPVAAETSMLQGFIGDGDYGEGKEKFASTVPLGRLAKAEDIANAVLFLASDEASMITGSLIDVDGGRGA